MKPKKLLSFLLATAMTISLLPTFTLTASADETPTTTTEKNITLGISALSGYDSTNGYEHIYYGVWNNSPIKWRILDTKTNMKNAAEGDGLFLLSDVLFGTGILGEVYFQQSFHIKDGRFYKGSSHSNGDHTNCGKMNAWQGSDAQSRCNSFYNTNLTTQEQNAILATTKSDNAITYGSENTPFSASENILNNDKIFFLSVEEVVNPNYGFTNDNARIAKYGNKASMWWLRSPYASNTGSTGYVFQSGDVNASTAHSNWAARPAFNLNSSSVLFTSAADGKKTDKVGKLLSNTDYSDNEYKLTIKDESRKNFSVTDKNITAPKGGSATISYKNAKTDTNEYISAMLLNEDDEVLYYGQIKSSDEADSKASVEIPASLDIGTYTLRVFNEQINGDYKTDYSSDFNDITLNVVTEKNITLGTSALLGYDSTNDKYKYVYYGTYDTSPIKWRILTMNGNDGTYKDNNDETVVSANAMFLLSEYGLKQMAYDSDEAKNNNSQKYVNSWRYSDVWDWCNTTFKSSSFTESEKKYFLKTSNGEPQNNQYIDELENDTFFFLSPAEAENDYIKNNRVAKLSNENGNAVRWWLRSPIGDIDVICVFENGSIINKHVAHDDSSARPAFNLNSSSVLFTSAANGKKTDNVGNLSVNTDNTTSEYKLTMKDDTRSSFSIDETEIKSDKGQKITLSYSGAKTGSNEYISAMIVKDGEVLYYGQGEKTETSTNENGTEKGKVKFTLPNEIENGEYTLYVFNEQINGDKTTDFSSDFQTVSLNVLPKATFTTQPSAKTNLIYDGTEQALVIAGETSEGTVKYSLSENGTYSADIPTGMNTDTYTVWYYIEGDSTHADSDKASVNTSIGTYTPTEKPDNKTTASVRRGRTLADASVTEGEILGINNAVLDGTFAWEDETKVMDASGTASMIFTPNNTNYAPLTVNVDVTVYQNSGGGSLSSVSSHIVRFNTDGGSSVKAQSVVSGGKATEPTEPTKEGYIFDGWYTDSEFTTEYDFDTKVTKNITLYAKWVIEDEVQEPSDDKKDDEQKPTTDEWKNPFTDVTKADWFFENVRYANENGLMSGVTSTEFAPNLTLTRGMLVAILYRSEGEPTVNKSIPFADVTADSYYADAVIWAEQNGIVSGINETEFAPDENITREQIAAIIYRFAQYKGIAPTGAWAIRLNYADLAEIADYAVEGVMYCTMKNIMQGKDDNMFAPKDNSTRAEIAAILQRFIENNK